MKRCLLAVFLVKFQIANGSNICRMCSSANGSYVEVIRLYSRFSPLDWKAASQGGFFVAIFAAVGPGRGRKGLIVVSLRVVWRAVI